MPRDGQGLGFRVECLGFGGLCWAGISSAMGHRLRGSIAVGVGAWQLSLPACTGLSADCLAALALGQAEASLCRVQGCDRVLRGFSWFWTPTWARPTCGRFKSSVS